VRGLMRAPHAPVKGGCAQDYRSEERTRRGALPTVCRYLRLAAWRCHLYCHRLSPTSERSEDPARISGALHRAGICVAVGVGSHARLVLAFLCPGTAIPSGVSVSLLNSPYLQSYFSSRVVDKDIVRSVTLNLGRPGEFREDVARKILVGKVLVRRLESVPGGRTGQDGGGGGAENGRSVNGGHYPVYALFCTKPLRGRDLILRRDYFARFHTISSVRPADVRGFVNFISSAVMDVTIRR
jgi:hypothetical protein